MVDLLQSVGDKIAAVIMATTAIAGGMFTSVIQTTVAPAPQAASIYAVVAATTTPTSTPIALSALAVSPAPVTPDLLPTVRPIAIKISAKVKTKIIVVAPTPAVVPPPIPVSTLTAQWLADNTQLSFKQNLDGTFDAAFSAGTGANALAWGMNDTTIGGTGGIPQFTFSVSCDPPPGTPGVDAPDQDPFFAARTPYDCTISFTPTSGDDQVTRTKDLKATTDPAPLIVTHPPSFNSILVDGTNNAGFTFNNEDTKTLTVSQLTVDLSYQGLNIQNGPLVFRVLDPQTGASLFDYHLEKLPANSATPFSNTATGITIPLSFTIPAGTQKLLPVEILGVSRMSIANLDPTVTAAITAVTADPNDTPTMLGSAQVSWSCVVPLVSYDPNATSGPFAMGTVCR